VTAWKQAGEDLGFKIEAPYRLENGDQSFLCVAYLPHFGGVNGMVFSGLLPNRLICTEDDFGPLAKRMKFYHSYINLEVYSPYDRELFIETLSDWGFFGPADKLPAWFPSGRA
jgi:hypothetical protein